MTNNNSALIDVAAVSEILGVCRRTVWRLSSSAQMPASLKIGRLVRWRKSEIEEWVSAGCPARRIWEALAANSRGTR